MVLEEGKTHNGGKWRMPFHKTYLRSIDLTCQHHWWLENFMCKYVIILSNPGEA